MLGARLSTLTACLCCLLWACGYGQETQRPTQLFCDDKMVEDAVDAALVKFNEMLSSGNQSALYQILEAIKIENETGTELSLSFTSRPSDCPVGGDKAWRDCEYFAFGPENPKTCKANVFVTEGSSSVDLVDCAHEPVITSEKAPCMGCPQEIHPDSEDLKEPLRFSVDQANNAHSEAYLFILKNVVHASRQVVAGFRYQLRFNMQSSNCSKEEFKEVTEGCRPDEKPTLVKCNSTVDVAPWRHEQPDGSVNCELGQFPDPELITRRRPPGWTPLRTIDITPQKPKKESSEEEQDMSSTASTAATSLDTAASTTTTPSPLFSSTQKPFSCPSKPWKQFIPLPAATPPSPNTSKPELDGSFTDADLLG